MYLNLFSLLPIKTWADEVGVVPVRGNFQLYRWPTGGKK